jgi:hypothetical protein
VKSFTRRLVAVPALGDDDRPPFRRQGGMRGSTSIVALGEDLSLPVRRGDDVVEANGSCLSAELDEVEVPGRRRHRTPLLALRAAVEGALLPAGEGGIVAGWPARNARAGEVRDASVDEGAHSVRHG